MSEWTAEQLKTWAEDCEGVVFCESAEQYRSHAAALERIAELEAENARIKAALQTSQNKLKASGRYKLREENARLRHHAEAMAEVLGWLNMLGGLGYDKHGEIERALVAYRAEFKEEGS